MGYEFQHNRFSQPTPHRPRARGANIPSHSRPAFSPKRHDFRCTRVLETSMVGQRGSLSIDPLGFGSPDSENLYAYATNNPINLVDPSGLAIPWNGSFDKKYDGPGSIFIMPVGGVFKAPIIPPGYSPGFTLRPFLQKYGPALVPSIGAGGWGIFPQLEGPIGATDPDLVPNLQPTDGADSEPSAPAPGQSPGTGTSPSQGDTSGGSGNDTSTDDDAGNSKCYCCCRINSQSNFDSPDGSWQFYLDTLTRQRCNIIGFVFGDRTCRCFRDETCGERQ
jgi:hypothetical protein